MHTEAQKQINKNWERKMSSIAMIFFISLFCNSSDNLNIHADAIESENRVKSCYVCDGSAYRFRRLFFFSSLLNSICDEIGALAHSIWFIRAVWPKSVFNWFAPVDVINVVFPPRARDIAPNWVEQQQSCWNVCEYARALHSLRPRRQRSFFFDS